MAITNLGVAAMLVILLQVSTLCAVAQHHGVMTLNGFEKGGDGGGPSECYGKYHSNKEMIVALSTRSYGGGRRCLKMIRITSEQNGRTAQAKVVDECDSSNGCKDSIVDAYAAVWKALGLNTNIGEVPVTWTDASNHASIHR